MKLAIIGAGTAGLALAALLAREHEVVVFERAPEPRPVGAGILLQPSGMQVLERMAVLSQLLRLGARIERLYGTLREGRGGGWPVMDMRYADHGQGGFGLGLSRHALNAVLLHEAIQAGAQLRGGQTVQQLQPGVGLPDFDLTVLANGSFSTLREAAGIQARVRPYPWGALWVLLRDPEGAVGPTLRQWYRGAHQMLGLMPTGFHDDAERLAQAQGSGSGPWLSLFWSMHSERMAALRDKPLTQWKAQLTDLAPHSAPLLAQIQDWSQLAFAQYADVRCARPFAGRVACIGDAAHAMSPQLGQGCNMALIDAWILAQCLRRTPDAGAFPRYAEQRRRHLWAYQALSRGLTPLFQSDGWLAPALRNLVFWPSSRLPGASRMAATILTGHCLNPGLDLQD